MSASTTLPAATDDVLTLARDVLDGTSVIGDWKATALQLARALVRSASPIAETPMPSPSYATAIEIRYLATVHVDASFGVRPEPHEWEETTLIASDHGKSIADIYYAVIDTAERHFNNNRQELLENGIFLVHGSAPARSNKLASETVA